MMKVLIVSGEYPPMKGGVGRYTFNLVHAIAKKPDVEVYVAIGADAGASLRRAHSQDTNNAIITTYRGIIRKGDKRNSERLLQIVSEIKPDVVNIQYERGLYEVDTTIRHTFWRLVHGSTLDRFYKMCPVSTVSTLHTVFPQDEYSAYIKDRALRKEGRFGFLPQPLRAAIRRWVLKQRYNLLLQVVKQSDGVISPARTLQEVVKRGIVIYHGAEPAIEFFSPTPSLMNNDKKEEFRKTFGLPVDKMLLLAFGYAGSYKGFDVLGGLDLPNGWSLVIKQTAHERGSERPIEIGKKNNGDNVIISLNLGYLDETAMSKLFFACDAIIFPYKIVSISGVMFDALAHGLPFVASDLRFFKEFADMGLGIVCKRTTQSFERSISTLALEYDEYKTRVEQFRSQLQWGNVANKHVEFFSGLISQKKNNPNNESVAKNKNSTRKQHKTTDELTK